MDYERYDSLVKDRHAAYRDDLAELCALPSVSAHGRMLPETAEWVAERLQRAGLHTELLRDGDSAPALWAEIGEGPRTLLFYNHYDVQPPEPIDLWQSDPFTLTERSGHLYARGVADNKGDLLSRIHALEAWRDAVGDLPLRVRFLVEGEEEVGSVNLSGIVARHGERWRADGCIWEGSGRDEDDVPAIYCGAKGMLYLELRVKTLDRDLHSMLGGMVPNAAWRLVNAIATMRDADGTPLIEGLLDDVRPLNAAEQAAVAKLRFDAERQRVSWGAPYLLRGLDGEEALVELLSRPTINVAGFESGYTGPGAKTVIPAEASAKIDIRLVPDMTAEATSDLVMAHLKRHGFDDIEVIRHGGLDPSRTPVDDPVVRASELTWAELDEPEARVFPNMPGTGPASVVADGLDVPLVMTGGVSWSGDRIHSPNENIRAADYPVAVRYWGRYMNRFARSDA